MKQLPLLIWTNISGFWLNSFLKYLHDVNGKNFGQILRFEGEKISTKKTTTMIDFLVDLIWPNKEYFVPQEDLIWKQKNILCWPVKRFKRILAYVRRI